MPEELSEMSRSRKVSSIFGWDTSHWYQSLKNLLRVSNVGFVEEIALLHFFPNPGRMLTNRQLHITNNSSSTNNVAAIEYPPFETKLLRAAISQFPGSKLLHLTGNELPR